MSDAATLDSTNCHTFYHSFGTARRSHRNNEQDLKSGPHFTVCGETSFWFFHTNYPFFGGDPNYPTLGTLQEQRKNNKNETHLWSRARACSCTTFNRSSELPPFEVFDATCGSRGWDGCETRPRPEGEKKPGPAIGGWARKAKHTV